MTLHEFNISGYHNRHIRFVVNNQTFSGAIFQPPLAWGMNTTNSQYLFVPSGNLIKWREADNAHDKDIMQKLSSLIDINDINSAEII